MEEVIKLQLNGITKDYESYDSVVHALKGVDLSFRSSEFVAILGQSGCGKTTLLNIIGGLDRYTDGDLIINGESTKNYEDKDWDRYRNHSVGFVFQTYNLIPHLTVLGNVELSLTLSGISKAERKRRAIEVLEKVGLHDQIYKKPNQMSGGQMQRVAIARALINNPDIILADEPTGALDTETSVQIMEILKEVSKTKLVIMVTHNPELAEEYATRIVRALDGKIINDTNPAPFIEATDQTENKYYPLTKTRKTFRVLFGTSLVKLKEKVKMPSMSFFTALALSFGNLRTKIARTVLTAFAGSIGIIGIALVLSISNGFQQYIDKIQVDTMSTYPLSITESTINIGALEDMSGFDEMEKFPTVKKLYVRALYKTLLNMRSKNNITDEYVKECIETIPEEYYNAITYNYGNSINVATPFKMTLPTGGLMEGYSITDIKNSAMGMWQEMIDNEKYTSEQYDNISSDLTGDMPSEWNEVVLFVDQYNHIPDYVLIALGLYSTEDTHTEISFDEIIGKEFKVLYNDALYVKLFAGANKFTDLGAQNFLPTSVVDELEEGITYDTIKITGILRINENSTTGFMSGSIGYTKALSDKVRAKNAGSQIVKWLKDEANKNLDPFTGAQLIVDAGSSVEEEFYSVMRKYGAVDTPSGINIYPKSFEAKDEIKKHLDAYNNKLEKPVVYTDIMAIMMGAVKTAIDAISYVLIAFSSVSLIVSSIMIAVITYISVLERTKEIGVLRSIGASKKDITSVFIAETFIIGAISGILGVVITYILNIPINLILKALVDINNIAKLSIIHAGGLIVVSIVITILAGLVPSLMAAKQDPVTALRSE